MTPELVGYKLISETATCLIYESADGSHELWINKKTSGKQLQTGLINCKLN